MKLIGLVETALKVNGEWWYSDTGDLIFADGETGDYNHEAVVIKTVIDLMCDVLGVENKWDCDRQWFRVALSDAPSEKGELQNAIIRCAKKAGFKGDLWDFEVYEYIMSELVRQGRSEEEVKGMSSVLNDHLDSREFSIRFWKWIRIAGNNMELPDLTPRTLKRAAEALEEIMIMDGAEMTDEDYLDTIVTVSTYTGKRNSVSLDNLSKGRLDGSDADLENLNVAAQAAVRNLNVKSQPSFYGNHLGD